MLSIHAACSVIRSYNIGDNGMIAILHSLKDAGQLRKDGYVFQVDLDKAIKAFAL